MGTGVTDHHCLCLRNWQELGSHPETLREAELEGEWQVYQPSVTKAVWVSPADFSQISSENWEQCEKVEIFGKLRVWLKKYKPYMER